MYKEYVAVNRTKSGYYVHYYFPITDSLGIKYTSKKFKSKDLAIAYCQKENLRVK